MFVYIESRERKLRASRGRTQGRTSRRGPHRRGQASTADRRAASAPRHRPAPSPALQRYHALSKQHIPDAGTQILYLQHWSGNVFTIIQQER